MKTIVAALAVLAALFFTAPARAVDLAGIEASTFILYADDTAVCSAQVVHSVAGETVLVTANHCVDTPVKSTVFSVRVERRDDDRRVISYTVYAAEVLRYSKKNDTATLRLYDPDAVLPVTDLATVEEAKAALFKGAEVLAAGYPGTNQAQMADLVFTSGLFTGTRASFVPSVEVDVYRATAPIWYGNSGGALYVQIDGEWKMVGVATQTDPETPWETSLWIPIEEVHAMMRGSLRTASLKPATDH